MPDFIDDRDVLAALTDTVSKRARQFGATELIGPMNPNVHHDVGIQISGFQYRNTIFMGYQPPYYAAHFEALDFQPLADFHAWSLHQEYFLRDGPLRTLVERVERKQALRIRNADVDQFDRELRIFFRLYCDAFADQWAFVPATWEEFKFIASDIRLVLKPGLALVAEWEGEPVGFVLSVPDLYGILPRSSGRLTPLFLLRTIARWRQIDEVRVMIAGVLPSHRRLGIHLPLFYRIACSIFDLGYRGGEISWVFGDNEPMTKVLPMLGARHTKTYRMYTKRID